MSYVLKNAWALLLGILLLQVGNGLQGTLLAIRGDTLGFEPGALSVIMSGYFVGFLGGSRLTPAMIRRVGHVRVFAALASLISAIFLLYSVLPYVWTWFALRVAIGFAYSGVYVVSESWLNDVSTNETRGKVLSAYLVTMMVGIIAAQSFVNFADPNGHILFMVTSVLVSFSMAPMLLSVSPVPAFERTKPLRIIDLYRTSPLGCVGLFILGAVFGAQYGMSAVYATQKGLSIAQLSIFVATMYVGSLVLQFPLGYLSDRTDRRLLIVATTGIGGALILLGIPMAASFEVLLAIAFVAGGVSNPLYSLLLAYTNDHLDRDDMAAASGVMLFINGVGAILGPLGAGWIMERFGTDAWFAFIAGLFLTIAGYGLWRMTRRPAPQPAETLAQAPVAPSATPVVHELVQELAADLAQEAEEEGTRTAPDAIQRQ